MNPMDTNSPVYHGLVNRRREIEGYISQLEDKLALARGEVAHLNASLHILGYDVPAIKTKPKGSGTAGLFHKNELPRMLLMKLRANPNGLSVAQLTQQVIQDKGWGEPEKPFVIELSKKIGKILARMRKRHGNVQDNKVRNGWIWRVGN